MTTDDLVGFLPDPNLPQNLRETTDALIEIDKISERAKSLGFRELRTQAEIIRVVLLQNGKYLFKNLLKIYQRSVSSFEKKISDPLPPIFFLQKKI